MPCSRPHRLRRPNQAHGVERTYEQSDQRNRPAEDAAMVKTDYDGIAGRDQDGRTYYEVQSGA